MPFYPIGLGGGGGTGGGLSESDVNRLIAAATRLVFLATPRTATAADLNHLVVFNELIHLARRVVVSAGTDASGTWTVIPVGTNITQGGVTFRWHGVHNSPPNYDPLLANDYAYYNSADGHWYRSSSYVFYQQTWDQVDPATVLGNGVWIGEFASEAEATRDGDAANGRRAVFGGELQFLTAYVAAVDPVFRYDWITIGSTGGMPSGLSSVGDWRFQWFFYRAPANVELATGEIADTSGLTFTNNIINTVGFAVQGRRLYTDPDDANLTGVNPLHRVLLITHSNNNAGHRVFVATSSLYADPTKQLVDYNRHTIGQLEGGRVLTGAGGEVWVTKDHYVGGTVTETVQAAWSTHNPAVGRLVGVFESDAAATTAFDAQSTITAPAYYFNTLEEAAKIRAASSGTWRGTDFVQAVNDPGAIYVGKYATAEAAIRHAPQGTTVVWFYDTANNNLVRATEHTLAGGEYVTDLQKVILSAGTRLVSADSKLFYFRHPDGTVDRDLFGNSEAVFSTQVSNGGEFFNGNVMVADGITHYADRAQVPAGANELRERYASVHRYMLPNGQPVSLRRAYHSSLARNVGLVQGITAATFDEDSSALQLRTPIGGGAFATQDVDLSSLAGGSSGGGGQSAEITFDELVVNVPAGSNLVGGANRTGRIVPITEGSNDIEGAVVSTATFGNDVGRITLPAGLYSISFLVEYRTGSAFISSNEVAMGFELVDATNNAIAGHIQLGGFNDSDRPLVATINVPFYQLDSESSISLSVYYDSQGLTSSGSSDIVWSASTIRIKRLKGATATSMTELVGESSIAIPNDDTWYDTGVTLPANDRIGDNDRFDFSFGDTSSQQSGRQSHPLVAFDGVTIKGLQAFTAGQSSNFTAAGIALFTLNAEFSVGSIASIQFAVAKNAAGNILVSKETVRMGLQFMPLRVLWTRAGAASTAPATGRATATDETAVWATPHGDRLIVVAGTQYSDIAVNEINNGVRAHRYQGASTLYDFPAVDSNRMSFTGSEAIGFDFGGTRWPEHFIIAFKLFITELPDSLCDVLWGGRPVAANNGGWAISLDSSGRLYVQHGSSNSVRVSAAAPNALTTGTEYRVAIGFERNSSGNWEINSNVNGGNRLSATLLHTNNVEPQVIVGRSERASTGGFTGLVYDLVVAETQRGVDHAVTDPLTTSAGDTGRDLNGYLQRVPQLRAEDDIHGTGLKVNLTGAALTAVQSSAVSGGVVLDPRDGFGNLPGGVFVRATPTPDIGNSNVTLLIGGTVNRLFGSQGANGRIIPPGALNNGVLTVKVRREGSVALTGLEIEMQPVGVQTANAARREVWAKRLTNNAWYCTAGNVFAFEEGIDHVWLADLEKIELYGQAGHSGSPQMLLNPESIVERSVNQSQADTSRKAKDLYVMGWTSADSKMDFGTIDNFNLPTSAAFSIFRFVRANNSPNGTIDRVHITEASNPRLLAGIKFIFRPGVE